MASDRQGLSAFNQTHRELLSVSVVRCWDYAAEHLQKQHPLAVREKSRTVLLAIASRMPDASWCEARTNVAAKLGIPITLRPAIWGCADFPTATPGKGERFVHVIAETIEGDQDEVVPTVSSDASDSIAAALDAARDVCGEDRRLRIVLDEPIQGRSAGLAVALAAVSCFRKEPIPSHFVATGSVERDGRVRDVVLEAEKLDLVRQERPNAVLLAPFEWRRSAVVPVSSLRSAIDVVWKLDPDAQQEALDKYRSLLRQTLDELDLVGLGADTVRTSEATIPAFVSINDPGQDRTPARPLIEVSASHPCLFVLGDPGSGKSTALHLLGLHYLESASARTPIHVSLASFSRDQPDGRVGALRNYVRRTAALWADARRVPALVLALDAAHDGGQLIYLLDGLDEVPEVDRTKVLRDIEALALDGRGNHIVATSRPDGFARPPGQWCVARMTPLSPERALALIEIAWVRAGRSRLRARARAWLLSVREAGLSELVTSPLFLRALLLLGRDPKLVRSRAAVLDRLLDLLLSKWIERRRAKAGDSSRAPARVQEIRSALEPVAFDLFDCALTTIARRAWARALGPEARPVEALDSFLAEAGVIVGVHEVGFRHLFFRDHLAAAHIATRAELWPKLWSKLHQSAGRQVFLLAVDWLTNVDQRDNLVSGFIEGALTENGLVPWGELRAAEAAITHATRDERLRAKIALALLRRLSVAPYYPIPQMAARVLDTLTSAPSGEELALITDIPGGRWSTELQRAVARRIAQLPANVAPPCPPAVFLRSSDASTRFFGACIAARRDQWSRDVIQAVAAQAHLRMPDSRLIALRVPKADLQRWAEDGADEAKPTRNAALLLLVLRGDEDRQQVVELLANVVHTATGLQQSEVIERVLAVACSEDLELTELIAEFCAAHVGQSISPVSRILVAAAGSGETVARVLAPWLDAPDPGRRLVADHVLKSGELDAFDYLETLQAREPGVRPFLALALIERGERGTNLEIGLRAGLRSTNPKLAAQAANQARTLGFSTVHPDLVSAWSTALEGGGARLWQVAESLGPENTRPLALKLAAAPTTHRRFEAARWLWDLGAASDREVATTSFVEAIVRRELPINERNEAGDWLIEHVPQLASLDTWLEDLVCDAAEELSQNRAPNEGSQHSWRKICARVAAVERFSVRLVRAALLLPLGSGSELLRFELRTIAQGMVTRDDADLSILLDALKSSEYAVIHFALSLIESAVTAAPSGPRARSWVIDRLDKLEPESAWVLAQHARYHSWNAPQVDRVIADNLEHNDHKRCFEAIAIARDIAHLGEARTQALRRLANGPPSFVTIDACGLMNEVGVPVEQWRALIERCLDNESAELRALAAGWAWTAGGPPNRVVATLVDCSQNATPLTHRPARALPALRVEPDSSGVIHVAFIDSVRDLAFEILLRVDKAEARRVASKALASDDASLRDRGWRWLQPLEARAELLAFALRAYDDGEPGYLSELDGVWDSDVVIPWILNNSGLDLGYLSDWLRAGHIARAAYEEALFRAPSELSAVLLHAVPTEWSSPVLSMARVRACLMFDIDQIPSVGSSAFLAPLNPTNASEILSALREHWDRADEDMNWRAFEVLKRLGNSDDVVFEIRLILQESKDSRLRIEVAAYILGRDNDQAALEVLSEALDENRVDAADIIVRARLYHPSLARRAGTSAVSTWRLLDYAPGLEAEDRRAVCDALVERFSESTCALSELETAMDVLAACDATSSRLRLLASWRGRLGPHETRSWVQLVLEIAEPGWCVVPGREHVVPWGGSQELDESLAWFCRQDLPLKLTNVLVGIIERGSPRAPSGDVDVAALTRPSSDDSDGIGLARRWLFHIVARPRIGDWWVESPGRADAIMRELPA